MESMLRWRPEAARFRHRDSLLEKPLPGADLALEACALVDLSVAEALARARQAGRAPACGAGCAACCCQPIPLTPLEALLLTRYAHLRLRPEERATLARNHAAALALPPLRRNCPLLLDGRCAAYVVRPLACRRYLVLDRPCAPGEDAASSRPGRSAAARPGPAGSRPAAHPALVRPPTRMPAAAPVFRPGGGPAFLPLRDHRYPGPALGKRACPRGRRGLKETLRNGLCALFPRRMIQKASGPRRAVPGLNMSTSTAAPAREPANALERVSGLLSLLRFAFPTMVMMVFNGLYTIVDVVFVARFVNTEALSAINIINPAMGVLWGLGTMLGTGGSALIARKMGGGDTAGARRNFSLLILAGVLLGLFFSGLGLLFLEPIIRALGASDILAPYCREYFGTLLLFTPAGLVLALFAFFFVAAGKPALNMALIIASGLTNTLLDYVFIVLLGMGVAGAALATGIAFLIPPLGGLCFFLYSKGPLHFTRPGMRLREFGQACFNGSSEMIAQLSISVTTYLFNITMLRLAGEAGVAALTITAYSEYFLVTLFLGFSMGVAPVISYNYGSGNHARQRRIFRSCLLFICVGSILVFSAALLGASRLIGIFAPPDSRVFALADQGFHIFVFNFLFCGYGIFASSLFTALSNGKVSAIIAFLRTFALIALFLLVLPEFLGLTGVWLAAPLAEAISALVAAFFVWRWRGTYQYL